MMKKYLVFSSMGFELVGLILASSYLGHHFDEKYKTQGYFLITLCLTSLVGWLTHVVFLVKKIEKSSSAEDSKQETWQ